MPNLVIVESPTKAKTISRFLGCGFKVESSYGHVRDLPKRDLGVDVENNFTPKYVVFRANQKRITALKKLAEKADKVYFATDEDREGEAISWHLAEIFKMKPEDCERITFHEITEKAINEALKHPRHIDLNLVDAQQARRVLDRLVGYKLSPLLWKKVAKGLSAGRVQSVAVRLIVEREREIQNFKIEEFWSVETDLAKKSSEKIFKAKLAKVDGKALDKLAIKNQADAEKIKSELEGAEYLVSKVEKKTLKRQPMAPFITSTLQQEANRRLGFSAKQTMMIAQQLYEGVDIGAGGPVGLITYMRTDSYNLAADFVGAARDFVSDSFGEKYLTASPRVFAKKSKLAQEAHEAIRPSHVLETPDKIKKFLSPQQFKLYNLIWRRAVASQMAEALLDATIIDIDAKKKYLFRASGSVVKFNGFLAAWPFVGKEEILPEVAEGEKLDLKNLNLEQHFTEPPARYSDATLVKALEEKGIGRPSTYAPTISTIIERGYVTREEKRLRPAEIALVVNDLLVEHFPQIIDYDFTAKVEDDLDEIAEGKKPWPEVIENFYDPFADNLEKKYEELNKDEIINEKTDEVCEKCGAPMAVKLGRYGRFIACTAYPECKNIKNINESGEVEKPEDEKTNEVCEKCGAPMIVKHGRFGKFIACSKYPECKNTKQILNSTGVKCPECGEGDIVSRRGKRGTFYGCSRYPDCKFTLWSRPTGEKCPKCGALMVYKKKDTVGCSNKECSS